MDLGSVFGYTQAGCQTVVAGLGRGAVLFDDTDRECAITRNCLALCPPAAGWHSEGMRSSGGRTPRVAEPLGLVLVLLAGALVLTAGVELALLAQDAAGPLWVSALYPATGLTYAAAGLVALWRRPSNRLGAIMVFGGLSWLGAALAGSDIPALASAAVVLATLPLAVVVHLLLAFPSGRLRSPVACWTVAYGYFVSLVLQVPLYLFDPQASPDGMLAVGSRPDLAAAGRWLQSVAGVAGVMVAAAILASRLRRATRRQQRVLGPLYIYGLVSVLFIPLAPDVIGPLTGLSPTMTGALQVAVLAGVPVAFAAGMLLGGFARTSEIQELGAWLGTTAATRPSLAGTLARALGDDSVQLVYWVADREEYVDAGGQRAEPPTEGSGRGLVEVELRGRRIGAVIYDAVLIGDAELVRAAGRVVALAVDHERLTAELLASREALRLSRARLVEAGDRERRRIAQSLHDGLQMKLVLLALEAQRLAGQPDASPGVAQAAITLRSRIDAAAGELRDLVHAVMPAPLIERGLAAAIADLVDRMPVPIRLDLGVNGSLPEQISSTAYFVVAETLANAVKHAHATSLSVRLASGHDELLIEVADDGVGGAAPGRGLGLRSLADRVDVLGGRLRVDSPAGHGTRIVAEVPCGS